MARPSLIIPKAQDKFVYNCFVELAKIFEIPTIEINVLGGISLGQVEATKTPVEEVGVLLQKNSAIIQSMSINIEQFLITYMRGGQHPQPENKSPFFDEITLNPTATCKLDNVKKMEIVSFLAKKLHAFDPKRAIPSNKTDEQATLEAMHTATLDRLESLNEELIQRSSAFRLKLEEDYDQKLSTFEEELRGREAKLNENHEEKVAAAEAVKTRLEKRLEEVDARDNTYVRRDLRNLLQQELEKRASKFSLTLGTRTLRYPIHFVCVGLVLLFGYGSYHYSSGLLTAFAGLSSLADKSIIPFIVMALKPLGLTAAAIGLAVFYIRWMNRWFSAHAEAEFHLKQFQLDIDRASWVVETALEWKASVGDVIPTVLLESISKNLFDSEKKSEEELVHPADKLASALLGTASNVRVKAGDSEIEFDGKKLKKAMSSGN